MSKILNQVKIDREETGEDVAYFHLENGYTITVSGTPILDHPINLTEADLRKHFHYELKMKVRIARQLLETITDSNLLARVEEPINR